MKKLLILMLVLGLASAANAIIQGSYTLQVSINGLDPQSYVEVADSQLVLDPSDTLWIGVHNSVAGDLEHGGNKGVFMLGIQVPLLGHDKYGNPVTGPGKASWTGAYVDFRPPLVADAPVPANEYYGFIDLGFAVLDMWMLTLTSASDYSLQGVGILDAKELHCEFGGDAVVYLVNADDGELLDTLTIHQGGIPEPATLFLLGLGAVILKKREAPRLYSRGILAPSP